MSNEKMKENTSNGDVFAKLFQLDVNGHTEVKKAGSTTLTYLSWAWAWAEVMKLYPEATYEIVKNPNGLPFFCDEATGYMVYTRVTINGVTREMWLPVMDGANKAMRAQPYTYKVKDYRTNSFIDKRVEAATMFDINKTVMRCLVKNLAMFGLGLYIYAGEDLPETIDDGTPDQTNADSGKEKKEEQPKKAKPSETAPRATPAKAKTPTAAPHPAIVSQNLAKQLAVQAWAEWRKRMCGISPEAQADRFKEIVKKVCNKTETAKVTADEWHAVMHMMGTIEPITSIEEI